MGIKHALTVVLLTLPAMLCAQFAPETEASGMDDATRARLIEVLASEHRSDNYRQRDAWRHPLETLAFFGLQQDMTVMELWPSGGWYTEVLAPLLRGSGLYYAAQWNKDSHRTYVPMALERYAEKLRSDPQSYDQVEVVHLGPGTWDPVPAGSVDMVLTFRAVHNWMEDGYAAQMFAASFRALKPGGILGLVQHRGDPTIAQDPKAAEGYVAESWVIALAADAGFEVAGSSQVNGNPKDLKSYPEGVWTLPPNLRLDDSPQAAVYRAVGESDRMTLKFVKPQKEGSS